MLEQQRAAEVARLTKDLQREAAERKRLESELRMMRQRLDALMDAALDAFITIDQQGRVRDWNPVAASTFGWTREEALGQSLASLIVPPRFRDAHREGLEHFRSTGQGPILNRRVEIVGQTRDGRELPIELTVTAVTADGETMFNAFVRDISERKRSETRLQVEHAVTRVLSDAPQLTDAAPAILDAICSCLDAQVGELWLLSPDASALVRVEGHQRLQQRGSLRSAEAERLAAFDQESRRRRFTPGVGLPGRVWERLAPAWISDLESDVNFPRAQAALKAGLRSGLAFPVLIGSDIVGVMEFFTTRRFEPDDELLQMMAAVGSEIGQFIQRRRVEERMQLVADSLPVLIAYVDAQQRYRFNNAGYEQWYGIDRRDLEGKALAEFMEPQAYATIRPYVERALAGEALQYEAEMQFPDRRRHIRVVYVPQRGELGEVLGFYSLVTDISDRKQAEEELRDQTRILRTLNRTNSLLAAELDLDLLVQKVTDAGTELVGAEFGAFFYNVVNESGEAYMLYTLSGVPREAFAGFPMPRNTQVFAPTFRADGIIRLDDVTQDPRYGRNPPYSGMPEGHLPVHSYLAAPVVSRSGEVLGGLFFGHSKPAVFSEDHEQIIAGIAAQAAITIDNARLYRALQEREEQFRGTIENAAVGIAHVDTDGRWLLVNDRLCNITGYERDEMLSTTFQQLTHPDDLQADLHQLQRLLEGEIRTYSLEKRYIRKDGSHIWVYLTVSALREQQTGQVRRLIAVVEDITDRKRAEDGLKFLAQASDVLVSSLNYQRTLQAVARLAVGGLADWCAVDILDDEGKLERLAVTHADPRKVELARRLERQHPPNPDASHGVPAVIRTGLPECVEEIDDQLLGAVAQNADHLELLRGLGLKSYLCVPLQARGRTLGALTLVSAKSGRRYGMADLALVEEVARRAAMAVDNARLYRAAQDELAERKRAESELRAANEHLHFTLNATNVGIWDWDMRSGQVYWSENMERVHGLPPNTFGGSFESFLRDVHPSDRARVTQTISSAIDGAGDYHVEYRLTRYGDSRWVEGKGRVLYDAEGRPAGMAGISMDITHRKNADRAVRESEGLLRAVVETAVDGIITISRDGIIRTLNPAAEKIFGYRADELIGKNVRQIMPEPYRSEHDGYLQNYHRTGQRRIIGIGREVQGLRKDGSVFPLDLAVSETRLESGQIFTGIVRDITDRKRAEIDLRTANQELREKNAEMEQFVYTVSHDLKSPLVTIMGFVGLLQEDLAADRHEEVQDSIERLRRAALRMSELIDDLLELSRIGRAHSTMTEVNVSALVRELLDELDDRLQEAGVRAVVEPDLPSLLADRARLAEVFENLLTNAIKYGCQGSEPEIRIGAVCDEGEVRFFIRDNGVGIDPQYHRKIFGLFQRLESQQEGTGVGLAIVARVMQVHGGRAWVESEVGQGATFWLAFPRRLAVEL